MPRVVRGAKCTSRPVWGVVAAIVAAVGIFMAIQGFVMQLSLQGVLDATMVSWTIAYYFVGVVLIGAAKMLKWKSHAMCPVHGNMK